jgi:hypothetical protein
VVLDPANHTRGNAADGNLIIGPAVAGLCLLTIAGTRSPGSLMTATLPGGARLIISPFILDAKFPVTASVYWSNVLVRGHRHRGRPRPHRPEQVTCGQLAVPRPGGNS